MGCTGHVGYTGEKRSAYRVFGMRSEGNRPLERYRRTWQDNIKIDFRGTGWVMDSTYLAQV
jgi:hypothetical protein